jgi:hypothetical protein
VTRTSHHGAQMKEPETQHIQGVGSRALLGATVASAVLSGFGLLAVGRLPGPPGAAETGAQVVAWFREHRDSVRWSVWAYTVSAPLVAS